MNLTDYDSPEAEALRQQFDVAGGATIIFLDVEGNEFNEARITGFINADEFLRRMPDNF